MSRTIAIVLACLAMVLLMYGVFRKSDANDQVTLGAVVSLGLVMALVIFGGEGNRVRSARRITRAWRARVGRSKVSQ